MDLLDKNMLHLPDTVIHQNSIKEDAKKILVKLRPSWSPDLLKIKVWRSFSLALFEHTYLSTMTIQVQLKLKTYYYNIIII